MKSDSTHRGSLRHRAAWLLAAATLLASCQPERPTTGPGSTQNYIATSAAITNAGEATPTDNTKVAYYVPNVLKHGTTAPVVVFLHGFQAGDPGLYIAHINHLWHQGYIVIFPMFNTTNAFTDLDQNVMVDRIVRNTNFALANIGAKAELDHVYVYGHSAGAAFGSVFQFNSGITPAGLVLAHPALDTGPVPVPGIVLVNFQAEAPYTTAPVVILTGDQDTIAPPSASVTLHGYLTGAASRIAWEGSHRQPRVPTDQHRPPPAAHDRQRRRHHGLALLLVGARSDARRRRHADVRHGELDEWDGREDAGGARQLSGLGSSQNLPKYPLILAGSRLRSVDCTRVRRTRALEQRIRSVPSRTVLVRERAVN
ncbi:MAG: hypothetical protein IPK07_23135 [Deltaproteobacteria bacterium]|nr:hypothetical protein [Deltaproteobacteria bacterium]